MPGNVFLSPNANPDIGKTFCMSFSILVINPGSTSTKIALYRDGQAEWETTLRHSADELKRYPDTFSQLEWRLSLILAALDGYGTGIHTLSAVVGRGGLLHPVESGVYEVDDNMENDLRTAAMQHPANLGAPLARAVARMAGVKAYIADPPIADELCDEARITGLRDIHRVSVYHALNHKAVARRYARSRNCRYEELNLIIAHMGGGISVGAHERGRVKDVNNAYDGEGPIAPERAGALPAGQLVDLCFSGRYTHGELKKLCCGHGGMVNHLGTNSVEEILERAGRGDRTAKLMTDAMCYTVAKNIGAMAAVLKGRVDAIILTGGIAKSAEITGRIADMCGFIAPVTVYPGEDEMSALAESVLGVLLSEREVKKYA